MRLAVSDHARQIKSLLKSSKMMNKNAILETRRWKFPFKTRFVSKECFRKNGIFYPFFEF